MTNPQCSSYHATQHFPSLFLRKKAVGKIRSAVRASLRDAKANQSGRQKPRSPAHQRKVGKYQDQYIGKRDQRLCDRNSYVTAEKIRNASLGMGDDCRLLQTFNEYLADFLKRVDKDRAYFTYEDYCLRRRRLAAFLEYEYHVKDIPFKEPKGDFIDKFVVYLSTVKGIASGTIHAGVKKTSSDDLYGV